MLLYIVFGNVICESLNELGYVVYSSVLLNFQCGERFDFVSIFEVLSVEMMALWSVNCNVSGKCLAWLIRCVAGA